MDLKATRVLIVEDEPSHAEAIRRAFKTARPDDEVRLAESLQQYRTAVADDTPDIVITDMKLPDGSALEILTSPPESVPFPIIVMTSYGNEQVAVEAMKKGAIDYVVKSPEAFAGMPRTAERALREWLLFQQGKQAEAALQQSQNELKAVYDATPVMLCVLDADRRVLSANPAFGQATGWPEQTGGADRPCGAMGCINALEDPRGCGYGAQCGTCTLRLAMADTLLTGRAHENIECALAVERQGCRRDMVLLGSTARIQSTGEPRMLVSLLDITQRKLAEKVVQARLRLSEFADWHGLDQLLQQTLDEAEALTGSSIGFIHFLRADQQTLELQTWSSNTHINCTALGKGRHYPVSEAGVWADCIAARGPVMHNDYAALAHRKGYPAGHPEVLRELVVPVIRGELVVALFGVGNKTCDYTGSDVDTVMQLANMAWEIVLRKQAEDSLKQSRERLAYALDASADGLWDWDITTGEVLYSPRWVSSLGYSFDEVPPSIEFWQSIVHPDDQARMREALDEHLSGRTAVYECENRLRLKSGEYRHNLDRGRVVERAADGSPLRMVGTDTDITERKHIEQTQSFLLQCSCALPGESFFAALARYLAETLQMDFVCIDRLQGGGLAATTLAMYCDGAFQDNVEYTLNDTPCGVTVGRHICCFAKDVRRLFPSDVVLQDMEAESYAGTTLWNAKGEPIGLIAVIGRRPLANQRLAESILKLVAVRAAAELERLDAEQALRKSEEANRALLNATIDSAFILDMEGRFVCLNEQTALRMGKKVDELAGQQIGDFMQPDVVSQRTGKILAIMESGKPGRFEDERNGRILDNSIYPILDETGAAARVAIYSRDITEQRQAEQDLRASLEQLRAYFYLPIIGIATTNKEKGWIDMNPKFCDILGYTEAELRTKKLYDITPAEDMPHLEKIFSGILSGELSLPYTFEKRYIRRDGRIITAELATDRVRGRDGEPDFFISFIQDITERKQAAEKAAEQLSELERWYRVTLNREGRVQELKAEVNKLIEKFGEPPKYGVST